MYFSFAWEQESVKGTQDLCFISLKNECEPTITPKEKIKNYKSDHVILQGKTVHSMASHLYWNKRVCPLTRCIS